ncbi:hypothetical protein M2222_009335 [Bradyrhizobium elkanii]|nr:hypothetical protein [Bradyrhizobium elkanii]MCS3566954.1 hypothetical protein [Bradyrhizobium elkanii]MCW2153854.1 hypothetical protein [Bradyrhizobium elkanii]MCW2380313.1 hypothetical protein [Bradyrhizobium elkanii]
MTFLHFVLNMDNRVTTRAGGLNHPSCVGGRMHDTNQGQLAIWEVRAGSGNLDRAISGVSA